jgi:hypothetical protein
MYASSSSSLPILTWQPVSTDEAIDTCVNVKPHGIFHRNVPFAAMVP